MLAGWVKDYRSEEEDILWSMPPLYYKVWRYLMHHVCFEEKHIPMKDGSIIKLVPGQFLTSYSTIAQAVGWYERGIRKEPNPKTVQDILDWLEKQGMISVSHGRNGRQHTLVTIISWEDTQAGEKSSWDKPDNESNDFEMKEEQSPDINKKDKNDKNEKDQEEDINMCASLPVIGDRALKKDGGYSQDFEDFYNAYPRKIEKKRAFRVWKARLKEKASPKDLIASAENYGKYCRDRGIDINYIKHPSTFLGPDKPYEEFIEGCPYFSKKENIPGNVKNALALVERASAGEGGISLW